jgi:hypothetical protein
MAKKSPLDEWRFLIDKWKGKTAPGQFGIKGTIQGAVVFECEPSSLFITGKEENQSEGQLVNKNVSILFYDSAEGKFNRKTFFSYGFVNNEVECERTDEEIKFDIRMEPVAKQYEGVRQRSYIRKMSNTRIATGLEFAKGKEEFKNFGEAVFEKTA